MRGLLLPAALSALPVPGAHAQDGQRAADAGRFAEARRSLASQAEAGDARAQFGLAMLLDAGRGGPVDREAAREWLRRSAEAGYAPAQAQLGQWREIGRDGPPDPAGAALWYARAAARGHPPAALELARLYAAGEGVPRNPDLAEAWLRLAAEDGSAAAAARLADLRRRPRPPAGASPGAEAPSPPAPASPADGAVLAPRGEAVQAELIWTAPAQRAPVRFFVEVVAVSEGGLREVFASYTDVSAALVPLDPRPRGYAWRVYAVAPDGSDYAPSGWSRFRVGAGP